MRKSKFSEHQIIAILQAVEAGRTVKDVCHEHEISDATYYQWKSKYGGTLPTPILLLKFLKFDVSTAASRFGEMNMRVPLIRSVPELLQ